MQKFKVKLWSAGMLAAATVAPTAQAQQPPAPAPETIFPGDFDRALKLMMAGEGGEAGIGINRVWPTLSVPALTSSQMTKALGGNSLVISHHYTLQFAADGTVGGYNLKYEKADLGKCPRKDVIGDNYLLHDGVCQTRTPVPWKGVWKADDHKLCLDLTWQGGALKNCYTVFFALDSVALVQPDGVVWGKAHKLKKGAAPDES